MVAPISLTGFTAWSFNDSRTPDVAADADYRFFAIRGSERRKELTVDYDRYSDRPPVVPRWTRIPGATRAMLPFRPRDAPTRSEIAVHLVFHRRR